MFVIAPPFQALFSKFPYYRYVKNLIFALNIDSSNNLDLQQLSYKGIVHYKSETNYIKCKIVIKFPNL